MFWQVSEGTKYGKPIVSNYDFVNGEDHVNGVEVPNPSNPEYRIHRRVILTSWRGSGTSLSVVTGVIEEKHVHPDGSVDLCRFLMVETEISGHGYNRMAFPQGEENQFSGSISYKVKYIKDKLNAQEA